MVVSELLQGKLWAGHSLSMVLNELGLGGCLLLLLFVVVAVAKSYSPYIWAKVYSKGLILCLIIVKHEA